MIIKANKEYKVKIGDGFETLGLQYGIECDFDEFDTEMTIKEKFQELEEIIDSQVAGQIQEHQSLINKRSVFKGDE